MPTILKVTFAFLAGLVVASGLALFVMRHREAEPKPAALAQPAAAAPNTVSPTPAAATPTETAASTSPAPKEIIPPAPRRVARQAESRRKPSAFSPAASMVETAQTANVGSQAAADGRGDPAASNVAPSPAPATAPAQIASARDLPDLTPGPGTSPAQASAPAAPVMRVAPAEPTQDPGYAPLPPLPNAPPAPHTVTISAGTDLVVRLSEAISTDRNSSGDAFRATLEQPIILDGFIIADKGSTVRGKVVTAEKAGHMSGTSELELTLMEINTTDGQTVPVHTASWSRQGQKSTGENAAKVGGGAVLGAIIGAVAGGGKGAAIGAGAGGAAGTGVMLATRGKPVALPVETRLTFRLDQPVSITEQIRH